MDLDDLQRDLQREVARLVRLAAIGGLQGRLARRPPRVRVRRATRERRLFGYADRHANAIVVLVYWTSTRADMRATLIHELVHLAGHVKHDATFKRALVNAAREGYGVDLSGWERVRYADLDGAVERALMWQQAQEWVATVWSRVCDVIEGTRASQQVTR